MILPLQYTCWFYVIVKMLPSVATSIAGQMDACQSDPVEVRLADVSDTVDGFVDDEQTPVFSLLQKAVSLQQRSKALPHRGVALQTTNMFSLAQTQSAHYRMSAGEFHNTYVRKQEATLSLEDPKCKNFYKVDISPGPMIVDEISQLFRPATEAFGFMNASSLNLASLPARPVQRMATYEDLAFPKEFHGSHRRDSWCEMFAVRTAQRPVKTMTATSPNGTKLMMPAIWKSASTSLTSMLWQATTHGLASNMMGPHDTKTQCEPPNLLAQCEKHTTFDIDAEEANVRAAFVRNPLDRFLASVYEHGKWESCSGDVCDWMVSKARSVAKRLAKDYPHAWPSCEHPSQTYFLSATDSNGKAQSWDLVARLEEFQSGLDKLREMSGIALKEQEQNTSGDRRLKQMYFEAIFSDTETLCSICKVYAQDFECLGYAKPDKCTPEHCSAYGISLQ
jgi:hypothetical protein